MDERSDSGAHGCGAAEDKHGVCGDEDAGEGLGGGSSDCHVLRVVFGQVGPGTDQQTDGALLSERSPHRGCHGERVENRDDEGEGCYGAGFADSHENGCYTGFEDTFAACANVFVVVQWVGLELARRIRIGLELTYALLFLRKGWAVLCKVNENAESAVHERRPGRCRLECFYECLEEFGITG